MLKTSDANSQETDQFFRDGYLIVEKALKTTDLLAFKKCLWHTIQIALKRYNVSLIINENDSLERKCDKGLIRLREVNPDYPLFVQASISRSPEYYRLCSAPKIISRIRQLLGLTKTAPLYLTNNGIIFTNPNDSLNKRSSNIELEWHKDTFFTIPKSNFLHVWIPLLNDANESIGTLQVCPGSHKEGLGKQLINPDAAYDHRYLIDPASVVDYQPISIQINMGQALIFDSQLIHRSGKNTSKHVRCTLIGLYHAVSNPYFQPLSISYAYKDETPESYFYKIFGDEKALPLLSEQATK